MPDTMRSIVALENGLLVSIGFLLLSPAVPP